MCGSGWCVSALRSTLFAGRELRPGTLLGALTLCPLQRRSLVLPKANFEKISKRFASGPRAWFHPADGKPVIEEQLKILNRLKPLIYPKDVCALEDESASDDEAEITDGTPSRRELFKSGKPVIEEQLRILNRLKSLIYPKDVYTLEDESASDDEAEIADGTPSGREAYWCNEPPLEVELDRKTGKPIYLKKPRDASATTDEDEDEIYDEDDEDEIYGEDDATTKVVFEDEITEMRPAGTASEKKTVKIDNIVFSLPWDLPPNTEIH